MGIQEIVARRRKNFPRRFRLPNPFASWAYLVTEVAEVGDVLLRIQNPNHLRGSYIDKNSLGRCLAEELGDAAFMLATLATQLEVDLEQEVKIACLKIEERSQRALESSD